MEHNAHLAGMHVPWRISVRSLTGRAARTERPPPVAPDGSGEDTGRPDPDQGGAVAYSALKRLLIGRPLSTREFEHQRLPKRLALGVFSTDAIASTAFATQ